jgi:DNA-binding MarR family transcriptional regulator
MSRSKQQLNRDNLGFLLARASQAWNEMLHSGFTKAGFGHVRPSYGAILVPLFEEDGLRLGELARRAHLSKQAMTTMVRLLERAKLVRRQADQEDARAVRVFLTKHARQFEPVAEKVLAAVDAQIRACSPHQDTEIVRAWLKRFSGITN